MKGNNKETQNFEAANLFSSYFSFLSCFFSGTLLQSTVSLDPHSCYLINHHRSPIKPLTSTTVLLHSYHQKKFPSIYDFPRILRFYVLSLSLSLSLSIYIYIYIYIYQMPFSLSSLHSSVSFRLDNSFLPVFSSVYLKNCSTNFSFPALSTEITSGLS